MRITQTEAETLRRMALDLGESDAAELLGVSPHTLARAAARFVMQRETHRRLTSRLASLVSNKTRS